MNTIIKNQSGRSMVEMLGVLAIIGVLSVGGIAGYTSAMEKYRANKTMENVQLISTEVRTVFSSEGNYADLGGTSAASSATGSGILSTLGAETSPFGGITLYVTSSSGTLNDQFAIEMDNIPQSACITIATTEWGAESVGVGADGTKVPAAGASKFTYADASDTAKGCVAGDNTIIWTYK